MTAGIRFVSSLFLLLAGLLTALGTWKAFDHSAPDFRVFYHAWDLVLQGHGLRVYADSPDRYLYAPGFAWLFSPLALIPREWALVLWCFLKAALLGWMIQAWGSRISKRNRLFQELPPWLFPSIALVIIGRPLLIDLEYGQVNLFLMIASVWALFGHFAPLEEKARASRYGMDALRWGGFAILAFSKVIPLGLLLVPWFVTRGIPKRRLLAERIGSLAGVACIALAPALSVGLDGLADLYIQWKQALVSRGLPDNSHNQSFAALLYHYFSGLPTHVLSLHSEIRLGWSVLGESTIRLLTYAWLFGGVGWIGGWIIAGGGGGHSPLPWIAVLVSALIVPSHLVWKPYFVFTFPVAVVAVADADRPARMSWVLFAFILMNLTGFDFVGRQWGARFEAASAMMVAHLILIFLAAKASSRSEARSSRAP